MKTIYLYLQILVFFSQVNGKMIEASQTVRPPNIDGTILINEWNVIDSASQFIQLEPLKGAPASESTVVYVMFDNRHLYFAFKCFHHDPSQIVSDMQIRDQLIKNDDAIIVLLDTHLDKRSGFVFLVNPLGTQTDIQIFDDGRTQDYNWDSNWSAAAQKTSWGWSVEIAIPFSSISYKAELNSWGVNFGRIIRNNSETCYWSGALNDDFRVSQSFILTGLVLPKKRHSLTFTPYSTLRFENSDITSRYNKWLTDFGGDASYWITPGLVANITVNPDFATVEADQEKINLTRWELSFPEKRIFFLEGNELYSTRIRTFYSRRIGDINYGGKIFGKLKDYNVSVILVKSPEFQLEKIPSSTFSILRVKRDVLRSSTIGITAVDKSWSGGYTRSISVDYLLNLGESWKLTGQWVGSAPGDFITHSAYFVRIARESNIYHYHIRYSDTGENFRENVNQTGFIREDDMREIDVDVKYKWWFENSFLKYLSLVSKNNIFWNHKNVLRSWDITNSARLYLTNRLSIDLSYNDEFKLYEKKFYNQMYEVELGYNTDEWTSASLEYAWGRNFDRNFSLIDAKVQIRPLSQLAFEYNFNKLTYSPDIPGEATSINILTVDYNFTRDLWFRLFTQNNTSENRIYFYGMFSWRFQPPFGALYVIYTIDDRDISVLYPQQKNEIFFLKLSYQLTH